MLNLDTEDDGELCIGCAGGRDVNVSFRYKPVTEIEKGDIAFKVSLRGLKGVTPRYRFTWDGQMPTS